MPRWCFAGMCEHDNNDVAREFRLREFMAAQGVHLDDISLLDIALTHASYLPGKETGIRDYESLEFVGDAVLGLVVATYLYEQIPGKAPGDYTKLRATVVNKNTVARVSGRMGIAPLVLLGKGEESIGGRKRNSLLADCLEAVIGAVFLSAGWQVVQRFVLSCFKEELVNVITAPPTWDYKSMLQNHCQALHWGLPQFDVVRSSGPDHCKHFEIQVRIKDEICGQGEGRSKKEAEQNASYQALRCLQVIE